MRASTSAWLSGDNFGAFAGCCACGGVVGDSVLRRFDGAREAAAETKAARRANSRREIAESLLWPIVSPPKLEQEVQKYECRPPNQATESTLDRQLPRGNFSYGWQMTCSRKNVSLAVWPVLLSWLRGCNYSLVPALASAMALRAVSLPGSYFRTRSSVSIAS